MMMMVLFWQGAIVVEAHAILFIVAFLFLPEIFFSSHATGALTMVSVAAMVALIWWFEVHSIVDACMPTFLLLRCFINFGQFLFGGQAFGLGIGAGANCSIYFLFATEHILKAHVRNFHLFFIYWWHGLNKHSIFEDPTHNISTS